MHAATTKFPFLWIIATAIVCIVATRGITLQSHSINKEILLAFKRVDSSLSDAKRGLVNSNQILSATIQEKKKKIEFEAKVQVWQPKVDSAIQLANKMVDQIEELKHRLKKEAGLHEKDGMKVFNEDNPNTVNRLMIKRGESKKLKDSLAVFTNQLIEIIPEQQRRYIPILPMQNLLSQTGAQSQNSWGEDWFKNIPTITALTLLNKIQNDVLRSSNVIAEFCNSNCSAITEDYDKFEFLTSQNSTYFSPGDTLIIKTGIGAFSNAAKSTITINGIKTDVTDYGFATYKKVVAGTGENIPVSISFKDPSTGAPITKTTQVTYKVAPPKRN